MKLINAEKFEAGIVLMEMSFLRSGDGKDTEYKRGAIAAMQSIKELIKKVPADYDMDAVAEQLEKKMQMHERCIEYEKKYGTITITEEFQQRKTVEVLKDAIEIVKGGGVDGN